jgi:hypothetical protein
MDKIVSAPPEMGSEDAKDFNENPYADNNPYAPKVNKDMFGGPKPLI